MRFNTFDKLREKLFDRCRAVLSDKQKEYTPNSDRLSQFKTAAILLDSSPLDALRGMMIKHTTSIYDLLARQVKGQMVPSELWEEKIIDQINYLVLLYALLTESYMGDSSSDDVK